MDTKVLVFSTLLSFGSCLIIPGEVPSILDTAFLPPIKKGTDSRIGFGFAFGNHADFQVMLEFGPQTNTMSLSYGAVLVVLRKNDNCAEGWYRAYRKLALNLNSNGPASSKPPQQPLKAMGRNYSRCYEVLSRITNLEFDAGNYLQNWAQKMTSKLKTVRYLEKPTDVNNLEESKEELLKNEKKRYEIQQTKPGYIAQFILESLKKLYGQKKKEPQKVVEKKRNKDVKKITEDLSNVDIH